MASMPADLSPSEATSRAELERLWARGTAFLGTRVAILGGAMSWVSERHLVAAISNAGGFGVIACGSMGPDLLAKEIAGTQALTDKPFGVNLITMHPQLDDLIRVCLEAKVGHVVLAGGIPPGGAVRAVKDGGARLIAFAPALVLAKRLVRSGVDALVIEGSEAGGHIGPVSLTVLAQEILPHIREVPVFVAGGIGRGEAILAYLEMGASGAQLGTRFAAAAESIAHPNFKRAFIRAAARDALPSVQLDERFPVIPVRGLVNEGTKRFLRHQAETRDRFQSGELTKEQAQLEIEHFWAGALRRAVIDGDIESG
ncbi:MAG: nitronate monooxygenase, partial [Rhodospirillales bacterium]|nr:nitronate monooxygenase [Rhodospirillales bacterium]